MAKPKPNLVPLPDTTHAPIYDLTGDDDDVNDDDVDDELQRACELSRIEYPTYLGVTNLVE
jgi:hypothetical protein